MSSDSKKKVSSWHIGVAAEAFVAAQFARYGVDVSVQYGAILPRWSRDQAPQEGVHSSRN